MRALLSILLVIMTSSSLLLSSNTVAAIETGSSHSLQALVDQASNGDQIIIPPGNYDGPLLITKSVELYVEEEGTVTLQNTSAESALRIESDQVKVYNLRIVDANNKESPTVIIRGNNVVLNHLHISTSSNAIDIRDSNQVEVKQSTIQWGGVAGISSIAKGNGIDLYNSHHVRLTDNVIQDVRDGIYMENSDYTMISGNQFVRSRYGIHCMYTQGTQIIGNTGIHNITGAMVMAVRDVKVIGNTFVEQSANVNAQGILLYDAQRTLVQDNIVDGNRVGLYIEQSSNNEIRNNRLSYNFIGLQLLESDDNVILGNVFAGNVSDAQAKDSTDNEITKNYWDTFQGIDIDGDGLSDLDYAINPFFANLVKQRPVFQLFFQSPGIRFLENLVQVDRSQWAVDQSPLMVPEGAVNSVSNAVAGNKTGFIGFMLLIFSSILIISFRRKIL